MAEIPEEVVFFTSADQIEFTTRTNGDSVRIKKLKLTQEQATSLAFLVNADNKAELKWEVKVAGEQHGPV